MYYYYLMKNCIIVTRLLFFIDLEWMKWRMLNKDCSILIAIDDIKIFRKKKNKRDKDRGVHWCRELRVRCVQDAHVIPASRKCRQVETRVRRFVLNTCCVGVEPENKLYASNHFAKYVPTWHLDVTISLTFFVASRTLSFKESLCWWRTQLPAKEIVNFYSASIMHKNVAPSMRQSPIFIIVFT